MIYLEKIIKKFDKYTRNKKKRKYKRLKIIKKILFIKKLNKFFNK